MAPLSGVVGLYGQEIVNAAKIACDEINESGGVLGLPLEIIIEDDGSLPESAVTAANKLVNESKCSAIIGNLLSNSRIAVTYRVAEPNRIPLLNFSFYEGSIMSRYFFHFAALPNQQIHTMIPYMQKNFGNSFFFAGNSYEWPRGSIDAAKKIVVKNGGQVAGEEYLPIGCSIEMLETILDKLVASGANIFVPYFAGQDQINLLTLFTKRGLKNKISVVMGHFDEVMASQLSPEVREGFYSSNTYFMSVDTDANKSYKKKLAQLPGIDGVWPKGNGIITNFGEGAYLCVKAFALAANAAKSAESYKLLIPLKKIQVLGPQGLVEMNPEIQHAKVNNYLARCQKNGEFEIVEKFGTMDPIIPERYRHFKLSSVNELEDDIRVQSRILDQIADAVFLIDSSNGKILYANAGSSLMFDFALDEFKDKKFDTLLKKDGHEHSFKTIEEINKALYEKGVCAGEYFTKKKNGEPMFSHISISTFTHAVFGEVWMMICRDITERKKQEVQIENARIDAEKANKLKSMFLANISHEIRTPMNAIIGMAELLADTPLTEEQRKYVGIFQEAGNSLLSLINDLLDISKIEHDHFELVSDQISIVSIVKSIHSILEIKATTKGLKFICELPNRDVPMVIGDSQRLRQIFLNIVGNAIKFTEKGTVRLSVNYEENVDGSLAFDFVIADTGIGISSEYQRELFSPFTQQDLGITKKYGGTGLGLYISKRIIDRMGGQITVESSQGEGTSIKVTLPFERAMLASKPNISRGDSGGVMPSQVTPHNILLVDDNEDNRILLEAFLKKTPHIVHRAVNGLQAVEMYRSSHFDVILMDMQMPVMDGYSATREIRRIEKDSRREKVAIIAITANAMNEDRDRCLNAGADDYISKPIKSNTLLTKIQEAISP